VKLSAGQGFRLLDGKTFRDVTIRDISGVGNTGIVFIGDASYEDTNFSGTITNTDIPFSNSAFRSLSDKSFIGRMNALLNGVTSKSVHFANPNGSTKKYAITRIRTSLPTSLYPNALVKMYKIATTGVNSNPDVTTLYSKSSNAFISPAYAAIDPTGWGSVNFFPMGDIGYNVQNFVWENMQDPMIINANQGIQVNCSLAVAGGAADSFFVTFEGYEV
jgi:hypothetical protein